MKRKFKGATGDVDGNVHYLPERMSEEHRHDCESKLLEHDPFILKHSRRF